MTTVPSNQESNLTQNGQVKNTLLNADPGVKKLAESPLAQIEIPKTPQEIGQAAFQSVVEPYRRGFQEKLETAIGETARRGIAFGGAKGPGAQRVDKLILAEQDLESDIAKQVGTQLGMTLQEQAFKASEAAKRFEENKELITHKQATAYGTDPLTGEPLTTTKGELELAAGKQGLLYGTDEQGRPLTTVEASKQLAEFESNLGVEGKERLMDYAQKLKGGTDEFGNSLSDVQITEKLTDIATDADKLLFDFKNTTTRGINPNTGEAYTDVEMNQIAQDYAIDRAERNVEFTTKLNENIAKLNRGTDDKGNPLTQAEYDELVYRTSKTIDEEFANRAMEQALIAEFGPDGIAINARRAKLRGDNATQDYEMLKEINEDPSISDVIKNDITKRIYLGEGWSSEGVKELLRDSRSNLFSKWFEAPDATLILKEATDDMKDFLVTRGFTYDKTSRGGLTLSLGIPGTEFDLGKSYGWDMHTDNKTIDKFNELWKTDPSFREEITKRK